MLRSKTDLGHMFSRLKSANKVFLSIGVLVTVLIIALTSFLLLKDGGSNKNIVIPDDKCAANNTLTFTCYKAELSNIVKENGSRSAFALLKEQYPKVSFVKSQCHKLVHVIGRAAYARYGSVGDTFKNGDQFCWAGYYHGIWGRSPMSVAPISFWPT